MGYLTRFSLTLPDDISEQTRTELSRAALPDYGCLADIYGRDLSDTSEPLKWYHCDSDMIHISKAYPEIRFIVDGEGEEAEDVWRSFFFNGEKETVRMPKWTPPTAPTKIGW